MREGNTLSLYVDGTHMGDRTTAQANLVNARIDTGVTAVRYTSLTAHVDDLYYTDSYVAPVYTGHLLVDVLKASDNSAISGAFASLKYSNGSEVANATSNATGWADIIVPLSVPHAFTDNYNLTVTATGYSPAWQTSPWCYACYNTTYTTTAMMTSGAASLYGYAFDMTDGSTLGGTLVSVYYPNETIMATDTTDSNGYYLVDIPTNGPSGLYKVTGLHTGFATYEVSVNYPTSWGGNTGFERDLYLDMEVPTGYAQLSISVVDGYGVGISGATVEIFQDNFSTMPRSYVTNSVGSVVALVPLDTWQVKANNGAGYTIASGEIVADSELVYSLVLKLSPRVIPTATPYPSGTFILTPSTTEVNMSTLVSFTISLSGYSWDDIGGVAWFEDGIFYKSYFWDASQNCWMEKLGGAQYDPYMINDPTGWGRSWIMTGEHTVQAKIYSRSHYPSGTELNMTGGLVWVGDTNLVTVTVYSNIPAAINFNGNCYNYNTGALITGATIEVLAYNGSVVATATSDVIGHYNINMIARYGDTYGLSGSATGYSEVQYLGLKYPDYFTDYTLRQDIYFYPEFTPTTYPTTEPEANPNLGDLTDEQRQQSITQSGDLIFGMMGIFAALLFILIVLAIGGRMFG